MRTPPHIVLRKKRGETPLEALTAWKQANPQYLDVAAAYAGRLDPMAEGKLLVLLGDECKRMDKYTKLDKEYEIEVLLDFSTDTGDVLGLPTYTGKETKCSSRTIREALRKELGAHSRKYPVYSSKTVQGKPLFLYALEDTLDTIQIPEHIERVYGIHLLNTRQISTAELKMEIEQSLSLVPRSDEPSKVLGADFRQEEVREKWSSVFDEISQSTARADFTILKLRVTCGSGAYMRTLADRIGMSLGTRALALSIHRKKIGKFVPLSFLGGAWIRTYK